MRENLIGYVLNALEPTEQAEIEAQLGRDPHLKRELELLTRSLEPLSWDQGMHNPPVGLASRCCTFVAEQTKVRLPAPAGAAPPSHWRMADIGVAAGVFLAATLLFWPAMNQSRYAAQVRGCQNNLRQVGMAYSAYSDMFPGRLPAVAVNSPSNRAGVQPVLLVDHGLIKEAHLLVCPGSDLADEKDNFNVPTRAELERAVAAKLAELHRRMGGSYSYSLGFIKDGKYYSPRDLRRVRHALMADAPNHAAPDRFSSNHGQSGQNVLFEDFHVEFITSCRCRECQDHIFENREGKPYAGLDEDDVVLGVSDAVPLESIDIHPVGATLQPAE